MPRAVQDLRIHHRNIGATMLLDHALACTVLCSMHLYHLYLQRLTTHCRPRYGSRHARAKRVSAAAFAFFRSCDTGSDGVGRRAQLVHDIMR